MKKPNPALYLTSANNHDWKRTGPFLREVLSVLGDFENAGFQETLLRGARWAVERG